MRVLHVANSISKRFGGISTVLLELAAEQAARGIDTWVVATNVDSPQGVGAIDVPVNEPFRRDGVTFKCFESGFRPLLFSSAMKRFMDREIASFDVVHIHGLYRFPVSYAALAARRQAIPYIVQVHGQLDPYLYAQSSKSVWLKRLYERVFDIPNLNRAGAIVFTAREELERAAFLDLEAPKCVIPNGIDWRRYENLPRRGVLRAKWGLENHRIVLFLGRLHHKKGLDLLIPAFAKLRQSCPEARLVIAGPEDDGYGDQVRTWIDDHEIGDSVRFVGMLDPGDVIQAYIDADVFALPSYTENFGMTVVEAMACQLPVVISDQVNIHSDIDDAGCGLVVPCDAAPLADALIRLLSDEHARKAMGVAGRGTARKRFSWSTIVDDVIDRYDRVIDRQRRSTERNVVRM